MCLRQSLPAVVGRTVEGPESAVYIGAVWRCEGVRAGPATSRHVARRGPAKQFRTIARAAGVRSRSRAATATTIRDRVAAAEHFGGQQTQRREAAQRQCATRRRRAPFEATQCPAFTGSRA
eukprot:349824-Chlamydomonas_euryale.AAC.5